MYPDGRFVIILESHVRTWHDVLLHDNWYVWHVSLTWKVVSYSPTSRREFLSSLFTLSYILNFLLLPTFYFIPNPLAIYSYFPTTIHPFFHLSFLFRLLSTTPILRWTLHTQTRFTRLLHCPFKAHSLSAHPAKVHKIAENTKFSNLQIEVQKSDFWYTTECTSFVAMWLVWTWPVP